LTKICQPFVKTWGEACRQPKTIGWQPKTKHSAGNPKTMMVNQNGDDEPKRCADSPKQWWQTKTIWRQPETMMANQAVNFLKINFPEIFNKNCATLFLLDFPLAWRQPLDVVRAG